ncbi:MAG: hypothetical protein ACXQS1_02100 [Methermicoccaceae archaeon]
MTKRDEKLFRFTCKHDDHEHNDILMPPELILETAIASVDIIEGRLIASQRGHNDGVEDMPMSLLRINTADGEATTFMIDQSMAEELSTKLVLWMIETVMTGEGDDAN